MYNAILRKLTSLSLLAILLTSSGAFIAPNAIPQAHASHNANLFVSSENSLFNNYFAGPQVIEVVVNDNDIKRLDNKLGEPDVTVNGKKLRMAQATDGNWYGYFADRAQAQRADATQFAAGTSTPISTSKGLDFGKFCSKDSTTLTVSMTDTVGFAIPRNATGTSGNAGAGGRTNGTDGTAAFVTCSTAGNPTGINPIGTGATLTKAGTYGGTLTGPTYNLPFMHVIRQNKTLNGGASTIPVGQIGIKDSDFWPFIQLYDLPQQGQVTVNYNKGGGTQSTVLTFDRIPGSLVKATLDRTTYPLNSHIFVTLQDPQLNVDPTDEDSWTWNPTSTSNKVYYQAFTRNGLNDANNKTVLAGPTAATATTLNPMQNIIGNLTGFGGFMFDHNGFLTINLGDQGTTVAGYFDNNKQNYTTTSGAIQPTDENRHGFTNAITFSETDPKSGIFKNWDDSQNANWKTLNTGTGIRGLSSSIRYNDITQSVVIGFGFGTLTMGPVDGEWNSGEKIPVTLVDSDANKNTKVLEHLTVNDPNVALITALKIGTPFTLEDGADFAFVGGLKEVTQTLGGTAIGSNSSEHFSVNGSSVGFASGFRQLGSVDKSPVQLFSQRAILNTTFGFTNSTFKVQNSGCSITSLSKRCEADSALVVDLQSGGSSSATQTQKTLGNVQDSLINTNLANTRGLNMFNYDIRSLNNTGGITNVKVFLLVNTTKSNSTGTFTTTDFKIAPEGLGTSLAGNSVGQARTDASLGTSAGFGAGSTTKDTGFSTTGIRAISIANATTTQGLVSFNVTSAASAKSTVNQIFSGASTSRNNGVGLMFLFNQTGNFTVNVAQNSPIVADFFSFGLKNDGNQESERTNNAIYRLELEETGASTGTYTGTIEYLMLNQLNIFDPASYAQIRAINYQVKFIAHEDLIQADARAVRLNYLDLGSDGVSTQIAAQQDAPTHSGVVSFDNKNYKVADTVTITLKDQDLNVDNDKVDIYTTVATTAGEPASDTIGSAGKFVTTTGSAFGRLLDIQFGQTNARWQSLGCGLLGAAGTPVGGAATGLSNSGFTLVETGPSTGQFTGTFQIPDQVCLTTSATDSLTNANGLNIKVNYVDFRDASGKTIEISDRAGVRGTTGSVKLDRTVYPVPFGALADFTTQAGKTTPNGRSVFPLHLTGISGDLDNQVRTSTSNAAGGGTANVEEVGESPVIVHIRVNDRDFDISAAGEDKIQTNSTIDSTHTRPPVKMTVTRGTDIVTLATAGTPSTLFGPIGVGSSYNASYVRSLGPLTEIAPDAGIFQVDLPIFYTDGPASTQCPATKAGGFRVTTTTTSTGLGTIGQRFLNPGNTVPTGNFCIRQGDVLTVEYTDPVDSSGNVNTVTDSATFDLRNGVLQSDKSVYIIGSDMILTLIEPDFNLDSQTAETKNLDLIEWDSHAKKTTMGQNGAETANFDAKPTDFRETGKDTGIFQSVIKIPKQLATTLLERGEQIHLEYTDWGPAGAKVVGDENQDIKLTIYTSNFGATVELDQKVYTWTDKVYITVVAPDHNFDSNLIDTIGDSDLTKVTVSTRGHKLSTYKLVETGVDTGIFTGEVILTGFAHAVDEATPTAQQPNPRTTGTGPTSGFLESSDTDGLTVSFLYTKDQTVTGSALIRWNIGEVQFVEASYPANGQGVLRIIDPDMNLNPEAVDKFDTNMWSDSDSGGIKLTMTETNEATGIFEGTVYFTTQFTSSGNRLKVNEGDTVTGEYLDKTLPAPYTPADQLRITATTFIGTIVPPLERAPASNPRVVDAFGNELKEVKVDQQIQITADLANGQDKSQPFAYLVQIQDSNGVTVSLSWITGSLTAGQSLNPAQSWTPSAAGTYTAQIFVWESVDNPNALSPPVSTTITVV